MSDVRTFDSRRGGALPDTPGNAPGDGDRSDVGPERTPEELRKEFPAKFNPPILRACWELIKPFGCRHILDPFAGVGGLAAIWDLGYMGALTGNEIEREWAALSDWVYNVDSTRMWIWPSSFFDGVISSPTYGNRMADQFAAREWRKRNTYMHKLGRRLTQNNTGGYYFTDPEYEQLHHDVAVQLRRVLKPGSPVVWNTKNSVPGGKLQDVTDMHRRIFAQHGFVHLESVQVKVRGNGYGANRTVRVEYETVDLFGFRGEAGSKYWWQA